MARYHVLHETRYDYGSAVSLSQQMLHLVPRRCSWQRCLRFGLELDPAPTYRHAGEDAFGNPVEWLDFNLPHDSLHVRAEMEIEVQPHLPASLADSPAWDEMVARLAYRGGEPPPPADLAAKRFLFESPNVRVKHELAAYAADCFPPGRPVLEAARALTKKIFTEFEFDPEATTVSTPVMEVLERKKGVCQDFAHLMIACLRSTGIPARYVSGYLLTHPPEGQPRMVGADASHAWVSVYAPDTAREWVDFDPTNDLLPDTQHITIAWGRDFSDVSPLRGVIVGGGGHEPEVAVTVTPLEG
jgi:transglutaminase-like putative cysteine protease